MSRTSMPADRYDRKPPADDEAERALLGSFLLDSSRLDELKGRLAPAHFYVVAHQHIYRAMLIVLKRGATLDTTLLSSELKGNEQWDEVGGLGYLIRLIEQSPIAANAGYYADLVLEMARRRRLLVVAIELEHAACNGRAVYDVVAEATHELALTAGPDATDRLDATVDVVSLADVRAESLEWLWPGRIPLGKFTLLAGDPGVGKSLLTVDIGARVSRGLAWPDLPAASNKPGGVVFLSAEDDLADTIRPRLDAAGADVNRIMAVRGVRWLDADNTPSDRSFTLESDLPRLEEAIDKCQDCRLVVIDPISAYLGGRTDSHNNCDVRTLLAPLADLAARKRVAVVAVTHLNKASGGSALYRAMGSLAFIAAARAGWLVTTDREDPSRRLLLPLKNNLAADARGLAYCVAGDEGAPRLAWAHEPVDMTADEALAQPRDEPDRTVRNAAADWLRQVLANGPITAKEVRDAARQCGHSWATVRRAKDDLGIQPRKAGYDGGWTWALTDSLTEEDAQTSLPHPT